MFARFKYFRRICKNIQTENKTKLSFVNLHRIFYEMRIKTIQVLT